MDYKSLSYIEDRIKDGASDGAIDKFIQSFLRGVTEVPQNEMIEIYEEAKSTLDRLVEIPEEDRSQDDLGELTSTNEKIMSMEGQLPWLRSDGYIDRPQTDLSEEAKAAVLAQFYSIRRASKYPTVADYLDAKVKQSSEDSVIQAQGVEQEATYLAACLQVKSNIPKE